MSEGFAKVVSALTSDSCSRRGQHSRGVVSMERTSGDHLVQTLPQGEILEEVFLPREVFNATLSSLGWWEVGTE